MQYPRFQALRVRRLQYKIRAEGRPGSLIMWCVPRLLRHTKYALQHYRRIVQEMQLEKPETSRAREMDYTYNSKLKKTRGTKIQVRPYIIKTLKM